MKKQKEQHPIGDWYKGEDIGALWREKQKRKKIINLNFKYFASLLTHMILIIGSFISCMYAVLTSNILSLVPIWFATSFFSLMWFSHSMIQNQKEITTQMKELDNE